MSSPAKFELVKYALIHIYGIWFRPVIFLIIIKHDDPYTIYTFEVPINITKNSILNLPRSVKRELVIFNDLLICRLRVSLAFGLRLDQ